MEATTIDYKNLFAELSKNERHHLICPMPFTLSDGTPINLPIVALNGREKEEVKRKAEIDTKNSYVKDGLAIPKEGDVSDYAERKKDNFVYWTVAYAVRVPGELKTKFFPTKDALFDCGLTDTQIAIIFDHYMVVANSEPWLNHITSDDPDALEKLIDGVIKDGLDAFFLNSLTSQSAIILLNGLIDRLRKLQTVNGSSGESVEDTEIDN